MASLNLVTFSWRAWTGCLVKEVGKLSSWALRGVTSKAESNSESYPLLFLKI